MASAILYGTDWCEACKKAEAHLLSRGVKLTKKNVETSSAARMEMLAKQLTGPGDGRDVIPVIDLDGKIFIGFSAGQIDDALGLGGDAGETPEGVPNKAPAPPFDWNPFDDDKGFGAGLLGGGLGMGLAVLAVLWLLSKGNRRG